MKQVESGWESGLDRLAGVDSEQLFSYKHNFKLIDFPAKDDELLIIWIFNTAQVM